MLGDLRLVPEASIGWDRGPLDGLNCYMRAIEAALRYGGYSRSGVVEAFATAVELIPRGGPWRPVPPLRSARLDWLSAEDPWSQIRAHTADDVPVLLYADGFWLPGDMFENDRCAIHHAVLVIETTGTTMRVLDTDGPADGGFLREYPIDDRSVRALARYAAVHVGAEPDPLRDDELTAVLTESAANLAADLPGIAGYVGALRTIDERTARSLDLVVLGHWQPQFFVLSQLLDARRLQSGLTASLREAANAAFEVGTLLLGMHRYADPAIYRGAVPGLARLVEAATAVQRALAPVVPGTAPMVPAGRGMAELLDEAHVCTFPIQ